MLIDLVILLLRIADAEENLGESEVREAHLAKSLFFIRIGDKVGYPFTSQFLIALVHDFHITFYILNSGQSSGATQGN